MIKNESVSLINHRSDTLCRVRKLPICLFVILIAISCFSCSRHQIAPVVDKSFNPQQKPSTHRVAPGDTLFSIAWRYGLKYEDLAARNGISPPYMIKPSQIIKLDLARSTQQVNKVVASTARTSSVAPPSSNKKIVVNDRKENKTKLSPETKLSLPLGGAPQWNWPANGPILSSFQGNNGLNKGIDLGGKLGEPVLAAASGQVVYAGSGLRGYGKLLIIKHNETFLSAYAHNDKLLVQEGDWVKVGQRIADMGSSGTDRVKLHFEIRREGTPVNPLTYLPRR